MFSSIGNLLLQLSIILPLISILAGLKKANVSKILVHLYLIINIASYFTLLAAFILSDFSVYNVFMNSSNLMPLIYRIAGTWGSHEGSIILWFSLLSFSSILAINHPKLRTEVDLTKSINFIISPISFAFSAFIYFTSNPFISLGASLNQGVGLNPLLQDIGLTIHPPILYMGYVLLVVPFIYSCLALIKPKKIDICFAAILPFSQAALLFLTCGIGLGSWWAYRELGWGGFWFFDPVENVSLLPLIIAIMQHHSILATIRYNKLHRSSIFFGLTGFLITIFSTFIVRSGLLISVHSFADTSNRSVFILIIFIFVSLLSYLLYAMRIKYIKKSNNNNIKLTETTIGISIANLFWFISLSILLFSIIFPVIMTIYGHNISFEPSFFTKFLLPVILVNALLAGFYTVIQPIKKNYILLWSIATCCLSLLTCYFIKTDSAITVLAIIAAISLINACCFKVIIASNGFKLSISPRSVSMLSSHIGFGLMILAITINSVSQQEHDFVGTYGDKIQTPNYNVTLKNIRYSEEENYYQQVAEFWVENDKHKTFIMQPENRLYKIEQAMTVESDIYSFLTHDLYIAISKINQNMVYAKIYYRPYIGLLWISICLIAAGIFISLAVPRQTK